MQPAICLSCGREIYGSNTGYPDLCKACQRFMSEEEIFAIMDSR